MLVIDGMATFFRTLVIVVGLLVVFSSTDYLRRENQESGEYYALIAVQHRGPVRDGHGQ